MLDSMSDKPLLRKVAFRLPEFLQPQPAHHAFVLGLNEQGQVTHNLQHNAPEAFAPITSVEQVGNTLYLGSLTASAFAAYVLPQTPQTTPDTRRRPMTRYAPPLSPWHHGFSHGWTPDAGLAMTVYNRTASRATRWQQQHSGSTADNPAAAADGADQVFVCVGNDDDLDR